MIFRNTEAVLPIKSEPELNQIPPDPRSRTEEEGGAELLTLPAGARGSQTPAEIHMKNVHNLLAWQLFVSAARTRSFSQAANLHNVDLPKASRLIAGLERELDYELFNRKRHPVQPTERAAELRRAIEPLLLDLQAVLEPKAAGGKKLQIHFSAPIELAQEYFSAKLLQYSDTNPGVEFIIVPELGPDELRQGQADIVVLNHRPVNPTDLIIRNYCTASTVPLATPSYLRWNGIPRTPADLVRHSGLLQQAYNDATVTQQLYFNGRDSEQLNWRKTFVTHDQLTLKRLLLDHHGITVDLSIIHVMDELRNGEIVPLLKGWKKASWNMCIVNRREDELKNARFRDFVLWLTTTAREDTLSRSYRCDKLVDEAYAKFEAAMASGEIIEPPLPE